MLGRTLADNLPVCSAARDGCRELLVNLDQTRTLEKSASVCLLLDGHVCNLSKGNSALHLLRFWMADNVGCIGLAYIEAGSRTYSELDDCRTRLPS